MATTQHDARERPSSQFATRGDEFKDPIIIIALETAAVADEVRRAAFPIPSRSRVAQCIIATWSAAPPRIYATVCL